MAKNATVFPNTSSPPPSPAGRVQKKYSLTCPSTPVSPSKRRSPTKSLPRVGVGGGGDLSSAQHPAPKRDNKDLDSSAWHHSATRDDPKAMPKAPRRESGTKPKIETPRREGSKQQGKDMKVLTEMVQSLAQKLKKRDKQMQELQEKADKYTEVLLQLDNAEERLVTAAGEKSSLRRQVRSMQSEAMQELAVGSDEDEKKTTLPPNSVDMDEFRKVRLQRDTAMIKAGELSMYLAESRAETDELRDSLTAVTELLQQNLPRQQSSRLLTSPMGRQASSRLLTSPLGRHMSPVPPPPPICASASPMKSLQKLMLWGKDSP